MKRGASDPFYRKAKERGFPARSVFKLAELDGKFRLLRAGDRVLDLGAAPGSWLQYAAEKVGPKGLVVGVDRNPLRGSPEAPAVFLQADALSLSAVDLQERFGTFDVLLSDLAPQTTGNRDGDHARSADLCRHALELAGALLTPGGTFVCKMYQGEESKPFLETLKKKFKTAKIQKPEASRSESREIFFVATEFRGHLT